jgi:hypothetical protein
MNFGRQVAVSSAVVEDGILDSKKGGSMKRLYVLLALSIIFCMFAGVAQAQTWTTANQITVAWDAVTVPTGTVSYKVYSKPEVGTVETLLTTVTTTQATVTFTTEGRYFLGAKSIRNVDGIEIEASRTAWSNVATDVQAGLTFGVQYYTRPAAVTGIRIP